MNVFKTIRGASVRRTLSFAAVLLLLAQLGFGLYAPQVTNAAQNEDFEIEGRFLDKNKIEITKVTIVNFDKGNSFQDSVNDLSQDEVQKYINQAVVGTYEDVDIGDGDDSYTIAKDGCTGGKIHVDGDNGAPRFENMSINIAGQGCKDILQGDLELNPEQNFNTKQKDVWFNWVDENTLVRADGRYGNFTEDEVRKGFFVSSEDDGHYITDIERFDDDRDKGNYSKGRAGVMLIGAVTNRDDNPDNNVSVNGDDGQGDGVGGDSEPTCEESGASLAWILCQVFNGVQELTTWLYETIIEPFLYTPPVSTDPNSPSFQAWSSFRVVGNVFLVIAMLVIVFGQSLGGGLIDAYTAKKVLPRILAAAILINLSVYIVAIAVDVSNVVGRGIGQLILAPFEASGVLDFGLNNTQGIGIVGLTGLGAWLGSGALAAALFSGSLGSIAVYIGLAVFLPAMLALIGVFVTLVLRRGLILFLVLVSPIAFALYCLPNTEKYFGKWWELMFKALLMYPIVAVVFAISDVLAGTIVNANNANAVGGVENVLAVVIAFALQIIPLFMIPYSFKLAGGALGAIHGAVSGGSGKITEAFGKKKEIQKEKADVAMLRGRNRVYGRGNRMLGSNNRLARMGGRMLTSSTFAGHNLHEAESEENAKWAKKINEIKGAGKDSWIRAMTARMDTRQWDEDRQMYTYKTLAGATVTEEDVRQSQRIFGKNQHAFQAALTYEMTKVNGQASNDSMLNNYASVARNFGLSDDERDGVWIGSAFANQDKNLQYKYTSYDANGNSRINGLGLLTEVDEKRGSWQMGQQDADTWTTMSQEVNRARQVIASGQADGDMDVAAAQEVIQRGARIAGQYRTSGGQVMNEEGQLVSTGGSAGAPGRVAEEIENFQALFNTNENDPVMSNYTREAGVERRDVPGRRSGDQPPANYGAPGGQWNPPPVGQNPPPGNAPGSVPPNRQHRG